MTEVEINGKKYGMTVNIGTLTFAEAINEGIPAEHRLRIDLGFILACLHGADMNCPVTMEDLVTHCTTKKKFMELREAAERELKAFNAENDDLSDDGEAAMDGGGTGTEGN